MMVTCPKCGFTQPKDRYCAKCGVDMVAFKPAEEPLSKKLLGSWIFQVTVFAFVILAVYVVIRDRTRTTLQERVAEIDSAPQVSVSEETTRSSAPQAAYDSASTNTRAARTLNQPTTPIATPNTASRPSTTAAGATAAIPTPAGGLVGAADATIGEKSNGTAAVTARSIRIQFFEAQRGVVGELNRNTVQLASYGTNFTGGVVMDLGARMNNLNRGMRALDTPLEYPIHANQPIIIFKGARDEENQNIGLTVQITPTTNDENGVQLQVEVSQALRTAGGTPNEQTYQDSFLVPKEGGAYMSGLLPHRPPSAEDAKFYATAGVLRVMTSPSFQGGQTELVMLILSK